MINEYLKLNKIVCEERESLIDDKYEFNNLSADHLTTLLYPFYSITCENDLKFNYSNLKYIDELSNLYKNNDYLRIAISGEDAEKAYSYMLKKEMIIEDNLNVTFIDYDSKIFTIKNNSRQLKKIITDFNIIMVRYNFRSLKYYGSRANLYKKEAKFTDTRLVLQNLPLIVLFEKLLLSLNIFISEFELYNNLKTLKSDFDDLIKVDQQYLDNYICYLRIYDETKIKLLKKKIKEAINYE